MAENRHMNLYNPEKNSVFTVGRVLPLVLLAAGLAAFFAFDLNQYVSLDALKTHRERCSPGFKTTAR